MSEQRRLKEVERRKKQSRQAGRIVNGIFIALVVLMVLCIICAALYSD